MNMTKDGIGWGVTQIFTNYTGATINVPVGCVVTVSGSSVENAKFSGTFALLSLVDKTSSIDDTYSTIGSSLPISSLYRYRDDGTIIYVRGGTFIRLS